MMERLTDNTNYCSSWSDCEMAEGNCVFYGNCYDRKIYNKLREYEDLEEQGLLMKLKHKIGDVVYYISPFDYAIEARRISMITQKSDKSMKYRLSSECGAYEVTEKELEKEYYTTVAEAEKALAEMEK